MYIFYRQSVKCQQCQYSLYCYIAIYIAILQTIFVQSATLLNFLSRAVAELAVRVKKINRDRLQDESESCATIWSISNVFCQKKALHFIKRCIIGEGLH